MDSETTAAGEHCRGDKLSAAATAIAHHPPDSRGVKRVKAGAAAASSQTRAYHAPGREETPGEVFMASLQLASYATLSAAARAPCKACGSSRMHYCPDCHVLVGVGRGDVPTLRLPLMVDVIKHPQEPSSKSTAVHAKLLAPDQVRMFAFPDFPEYDATKTVLAFPADDAMDISDIPFATVERVVFIDSRWSQCRRMLEVRVDISD